MFHKNNSSKENFIKEWVPDVAFEGGFSSRGVPDMSGGGLEEKPPLGIATELGSPPFSENVEIIDRSTGEFVSVGCMGAGDVKKHARKLRYELQVISSEILLNYYEEKRVNAKGYEKFHRTCNCARYRTGNTTQIVKSVKHKKAFYAGLMNCANARTCPVCAASINERKSNEMRVAANMCDSLDLKMSMITFTAPHSADDPIDDLCSKMGKALSKFWRNNSGTKFKERYGIIGHIRSFEVRYGKNGWHPHFHVIVFQKKDALPLPKTERTPKGKPRKLSMQSESFFRITERWQRACLTAGLSCPNEYGLDIQDGSQAGEYITKFGSDGEILKTQSGKEITWDVADEMTKGNTKKGSNGSLSPWDLLALSKNEDLTSRKRAHYRQLFLSYARAMERKTQIKWSRYLRDVFSLGEEKTDEEILQEQEDKADLLCHITPNEWNLIVKRKERHLVLDLAENGGKKAVARYLHSLVGVGSFADYFVSFTSRSEGTADDMAVEPTLKNNYFGSMALTSVSEQVEIALIGGKQLSCVSFDSVSDIVDKVFKDSQSDEFFLIDKSSISRLPSSSNDSYFLSNRASQLFFTGFG